VRFPIDAQLPARLAGLLSAAGHDAVHTSQLPEGNRTTDAALASYADAEDRVVVTKDRDFRDSHLLRGLVEPRSAERGLRDHLAAIADYQQQRKQAVNDSTPRRRELEMVIARLDAALEHTPPPTCPRADVGPLT
jgi:uncharacterized protein with PIN domain